MHASGADRGMAGSGTSSATAVSATPASSAAAERPHEREPARALLRRQSPSAPSSARRGASATPAAPSAPQIGIATKLQSDVLDEHDRRPRAPARRARRAAISSVAENVCRPYSASVAAEQPQRHRRARELVAVERA